MKISNPLLISLFIILLIALNIYIIPQQRKLQLQIDKRAIWKMPILKDYDRIITPYSLIESIDTEPIFQLRSTDKATGKPMKFKAFPDEIGSAQKVICIGDVIYVIFVTNAIYKLDAKTLKIIWRIDFDLLDYNWDEIDIEQSKDLILITASYPYFNFYTFINQATGDIYYKEKKTKESIHIYSIIDILAPLKDVDWSDYYNFKKSKFIFNKVNKTISFIEDDYLMDMSDSLRLISFEYGATIYKKIYERNHTSAPFNLHQSSLEIRQGVVESYTKRLTNIQPTSQCIFFRFEKTKEYTTYGDIPVVDYSFIAKEKNSSSLNIHNINASTETYLLDDYFIAIRSNFANKNEIHKELIIVDLNDLSIKAPLYFSSELVFKNLLCDKKQLYFFIKEADEKMYCIAVPLDF